MLLASRQFAGALSLLVLLVLLGGSVIPAGGAWAQAPTPTPEVAAAAATPTAECPAPNSEAFAATESSDSPYYDYAILLDVSLSMEGWRGIENPQQIDELNIFAEVKESLKTYVSELQPGSMVYIIPFGNPVDPTRVRQFGIEQEAPDGGEAEALAYIDSIQADNNETHITDSVGYALDMLDSLRDDERQHIQTILLYTDGIGNGDEDVDSEQNFDPTNLVTTLRTFRQEQPYLFVKYVSLGIEVPGRETLEQNGVEVVETVQGVPPVREVRLAVVPETLEPLTPGGSASNRLCATSGDLGDGITVLVNDDPSQLPPDVQLAFRAGGSTLDDAGIPLTYTLANRPSGAGPFTTEIEVRPEDSTVFLVPSRLPVTFSVADPTATLTLGSFSEQTVVRGMDTADLAWRLPIDLATGTGGEVGLQVDRSELDELAPGASVGFRAEDGSLSETAELNGDMPQVELVLSASQESLAAVGNEEAQIPVEVVVTPRDTDLTIEGGDVRQNGNGTSTVSLPAPLVMQPPPTCSVEVGAMQGQTVTVGEASTEPVRWNALVELDGSDGCQGEVAFNDDALRQAIPGAEVTFLVGGEERAELDLGDDPLRANLTVTAPRDAVIALGSGEHTATVDLIVAPVRSQFVPPQGATQNDDGTHTIPAPVRITVREQLVASCVLPSFDAQEVIRDGATEPPLQWTGPIECEMSEAATVTMQIAGTDPGVTARFVTEGAEPSDTVTLADGEPMPTLTLEVERGAAQNLGAGNREVAAVIHVSPEPASVELEVAGATPDERGGVSARVVAPIRVVAPTAELTFGQFAPETVVRGMGTADVEWTQNVVLAAGSGGRATLTIDRSQLAETLPSAAFGFRSADGALSDEVELDGGQPRAELVLSAPQADLAALPDGEHQLPVAVVVTPRDTDLTIDGAEAVPNGDRTFTASLPAPLVMQPPPICSVEVGEMLGQTVTVGEASTEPVRWGALVQLDGSNGCQGEVAFNDDALREMIPGAEATFLVSEEERAELDLGDDRFRADLVVTAPRDAVIALGPGEHTVIVELIVTPVRSQFAPPEGSTQNENGSYTIPISVRITVGEQVIVRCELPSFDVQEVTREGAAEPPLQWSGPVSCAMGGGATVTLRVAETDAGVTARFVTEGEEPAPTVILANGDPMPTLSLEVERGAAQSRGAGSREVAAVIHVSPEPASAALEVEGASQDESGGVNARVVAPIRVVEPPPPPTATLTFAQFAPQIVVRGMDTADVKWTAAVDFTGQPGAESVLHVDRTALDEVAPGAALGFWAEDGSLVDEMELNGNQPRAELVLSASQEVLAALPDGERQLPADVIVTPRETDLTIEGAAAVPNGDGTSTVSLLAPLVMQPPPTCSIQVEAPPARAVTIGDASDDLVRWETVVVLDGSDGCQGEVKIDDAGLRQTIQGARATFLDNGEERASLILADNPFRALLVVTAPRDAVAGLGPGEHTETVELIVTLARSLIEIPEGATENDNGTYTIAVPVHLTVRAQEFANCVLPSFDAQEVILDGTTESPLTWAEPVACEMSDGATVILRIAGTEPGLTAGFVTEGQEPERTVTLQAGDPMPSLSLAVDRAAAQRLGVGNHAPVATIHVRLEPASAVLDVEGETPDENGEVNARVPAPFRVVEQKSIDLGPIELEPDPIEIETRGTAPDPLEWRDELEVELQNGAQGTVAINEGELPEGVDAFFEAGGTRLPSPVALAGQQGTIELVVQGSLAAAQALGAGEHEWPIEIVLDPQGAQVSWPGAVPEGNSYVAKANANLMVTETPSLRLWTPVFESKTESSATQSNDDVSLSARVNYELGEGAAATLSTDDAKLEYGATAELTVDGETVEEPVELNGQEVQLRVTVPREALTDEKDYGLTVDLLARSENAVIVAIDDVQIEPVTDARLSSVANLTYSIPSVTLDLGTWAPEVVEVPSNGTGAEPRHWERTIVASEMEAEARPSITLDLDDTELAEAATIRFEDANGSTIEEATGGGAVTVSLEPGQEQVIVVVEAPEDRLRGLGLGDDHALDGTLTVDPNGAIVEVPGNDGPIDEPTPQEFSVRTSVFEPFDPIPLIRNILLALLAVVVALALFYFRPGLPPGAAIEAGGGPVPIPRGGGMIGPGGFVDALPAGEIKTRWRGLRTGEATFVPVEPVVVSGETYGPANPVGGGDAYGQDQETEIEQDQEKRKKSAVIVPDDIAQSAEGGDEWKYVVVDDYLADGGDGNGGDGDG